MRKVYILEKFETVDEMMKSIDELKAAMAALPEDKRVEAMAAYENIVGALEANLRNNPNGRWYGFEGKVMLKQFVPAAAAAVERNPDGKFRVVVAEIADNVKYWNGYQNAVVDDDLFRRVELVVSRNRLTKQYN